MIYICLITAPGHVIETVRTFELESEGVACDTAMAVARSFSSSHGYEIWRDGRKIAAYFAKPLTGAAANRARLGRNGDRGRRPRTNARF